MKPSIQLHELSLSYPDGKVFDQISAAFPLGSSHLIQGVSGAGKTTLLRLLMGLMKPTSGRILVPEDQKLAAVFQEDRLVLPLTVRKNLDLVIPKDRVQSDQYKQRIREALGALDLPEEILERPASTLSGGQRRRIALLRACIAEADILFFDEALKGLDELTYDHVASWLHIQLQGRTVFWVTHAPEEASLFEDPYIWCVEHATLTLK